MEVAACQATDLLMERYELHEEEMAPGTKELLGKAVWEFILRHLSELEDKTTD